MTKLKPEITGLVGAPLLRDAVSPGGVAAENTAEADMAREFSIGARKFWVVSEPHSEGWKAHVLEVIDEVGATHTTGIETTGETRSMADDRAIGELQHRFKDQSF